MNTQKAQLGRESSKKPYSVPVLQVYGDLAEIAGTVGSTSTVIDSPVASPNKTH